MGTDMDGDFLREGVQLLSQILIVLEAEDLVCAAKYERSPGRKTIRNGYRGGMWHTRVGEIPLDIPKLQVRTFFSILREPHKRQASRLKSLVRLGGLRLEFAWGSADWPA
jgi:transposase-like protein